MREEIANRCVLGIRYLEILSYEDQALASVPADEIRRTMVAAVRQQIAVTFDPNGMNLHADHIAISRFASDAVAAAKTPDGVRKPASDTRWSACFGADRGASSISAGWRT